MRSRWTEEAEDRAVAQWGATGVPEDVARRTYTARLIGAEPELVLHGGGNTSVKSTATDLLGREIAVLHVKGSGLDLKTIEPWGHPALCLDGLLALRTLAALSDEDMVTVQRTHLLDARTPSPSVEFLLHAFLPHKFVDHTHADGVLSLVNQVEARGLCREVYGSEVGIVEYLPSGFELARAAVEVYEADPSVRGLLLLHHGIVTFGQTARQSYEAMIELVTRAEEHVAARSRPAPKPRADVDEATRRYVELAPRLRGAVAHPTDTGGESWRRFTLEFRSSEAILAFLERPDLMVLTQKGPPTPDHVIRTKPVPLVVEDPGDLPSRVEEFRRGYEAYVDEMSVRRGLAGKALHPSPCIVLLPGVGLVGVGEDCRAAEVAADLYEQTIKVLDGAQACGEYQPLDRARLFDMEYWSLEQAKLDPAATEPLAGQVALVTGGASGIGAATAEVFSQAGAHLVLWDLRDEALESTRAAVAHPRRTHVQVVDVTDPGAVQSALGQAVRRFGGLDILVSNAGRAWTSPMAECSPELLAESFALNLYAHQYVASGVARILKEQGTGGVLLFNASKSSFNPGPDFGPYTLPKTALIALMKQYAVELGRHGIRANAVNADRIRTHLFSGGVLEARARARDLSVDEYFKSNLLRQEVRARDVAEAFLHLALCRKTSAAVLPVDGGNIAASPR